MINEHYEIQVISKDGQKQTLILRRIKKEDAPRLYKSWSNPQSYRFNEIPRGVKYFEDGSVKTGVQLIEDIALEGFPDEDGQYFFVLELKETGELVGNCRFGCCKNWKKKYAGRDDVWDFGYNIVRADDKDEYTYEDIEKAFHPNGLTRDTRYWGKGYISAVIKLILELAQKEGISKVVSGADILNYGSIKPMLKNGMEFIGLDKDLDPECEIDLTQPIKIPTKEEIDTIWETYLDIVKYTISKHQEELKKNTTNQFNKAIQRWQETRDFYNDLQKL